MYTDWTAVALLLVTTVPLLAVVVTAAFFLWPQRETHLRSPAQNGAWSAEVQVLAMTCPALDLDFSWVHPDPDNQDTCENACH